MTKNRVNHWRLSMSMMDMLCHLRYEPTVVHWENIQGFFTASARASHGYMICFPYKAGRTLYDALAEINSMIDVARTAIAKAREE